MYYRCQEYLKMLNNIYSKRDISDYLKSSSIFPNKNRGQNFLCDRNIAYNIANTVPSGFLRSNKAIEIGGGLGSLSDILINIYKENLTVVEYDKALYNFLFSKYGEIINILHKDILTVNIDEIAANEKIDVYGNIPYNIASPIIEWLLRDSYGKWNYAVFMVQSDFANRLTAKEGTEDYSSLSVFSQFMSRVKIESDVSKNVFLPIPKVSSSVISIIPKEVDVNIVSIFKTLSKTIFHNRRKTLRNNLLHSPYMNIDEKNVAEIMNKLSIKSDERGENLSLDTIEKIAYLILEYQ